MTDKRRGLGRGLGALIPTGSNGQRPVAVFFPDIEGARSARALAVDERVNSSGIDLAALDAPLPARTNGRRPRTASADVPRGTDELVPVPGARFAELPVG